MSAAAPWIVQTLIGSALLMLLVLVARRPVARWFGAKVAYALWLLPALRMVLPPLPGHRQLFVPLLRIVQGQHTEVTVGLMPPEAAPEMVVFHGVAGVAPIAPAAGWGTIVLTVWLAGAALWLAVQLIRHARFLRRSLAGATALGREARTDILIADVTGPIAAGLIHRRIFLPRDFMTRYSAGERRQALLHEGAHHDRLDLVANFAALAVVALHWWNPLAHIAHRAFRSDQELACDATVLEQADGEQRFHYGSALVKSAAGRTPVAACAMRRTDEVKQRLAMIKRGSASTPVRTAGLALAAGLIAMGLVATASGSAAIPSHPLAGSEAAIAPAQDRDARLEAEQEAREAANDARQDAMEAARDARDDKRDALRDARDARREAMIEARDAQREALRASADARRQAYAAARQGPGAACADAIGPDRAEADWAKFGGCMKSRAMAAALPQLEQARAELAASDLGAQRISTLARIDAAIGQMRTSAGR